MTSVLEKIRQQTYISEIVNHMYCIKRQYFVKHDKSDTYLGPINTINDVSNYEKCYFVFFASDER